MNVGAWTLSIDNKEMEDEREGPLESCDAMDCDCDHFKWHSAYVDASGVDGRAVLSGSDG